MLKLLNQRQKERNIRKIKSSLMILGAVASVTVITYLSVRFKETKEAEAAARENATKASVTTKVQFIKNELKKCEAFLADFEIEGVGTPDKFDKKAPIDPGTYRYKLPLDRDSPPRPDAGDPSQRKNLPRFDLVINMKGNGEIDLSVWADTLTPLAKKYPLSGTGTTMQISVDGNAIDLGPVVVDEKFYNYSSSYFSATSIKDKLPELRKLITNNKVRPIYVRFRTEGSRQITGVLHTEEERFQKYFELADILEKKERLQEELASHTDNK